MAPLYDCPPVIDHLSAVRFIIKFISEISHQLPFLTDLSNQAVVSSSSFMYSAPGHMVEISEFIYIYIYIYIEREREREREIDRYI